MNNFKFYLVALIVFCFSQSVSAQINAVTDAGEQVLLYNDGTWKYQHDSSEEQKEIPTNTTIFTKPSNSTFLLKSSKIKMGVWLDSKKWKFTKASNNPNAEYELSYKNDDLYAMFIAEKIEIPIDVLGNQAVENARSVAPDISVVKKEYRTVNGLKVLLLEMKGTTKGIKFSYLGYYYSGKNQIVQFVTYTSTSLMEENKKNFEELLNGLVTIE